MQGNLPGRPLIAFDKREGSERERERESKTERERHIEREGGVAESLGTQTGRGGNLEGRPLRAFASVAVREVGRGKREEGRGKMKEEKVKRAEETGRREAR